MDCIFVYSFKRVSVTNFTIYPPLPLSSNYKSNLFNIYIFQKSKRCYNFTNNGLWVAVDGQTWIAESHLILYVLVTKVTKYMYTTSNNIVKQNLITKIHNHLNI